MKFHYDFSDKLTRLNNFLFMNDLKLFAKPHNLNTVHTFSEDIGMEFMIKKCGVLVFKRRKFDKARSRGNKNGIC